MYGSVDNRKKLQLGLALLICGIIGSGCGTTDGPKGGAFVLRDYKVQNKNKILLPPSFEKRLLDLQGGEIITALHFLCYSPGAVQDRLIVQVSIKGPFQNEGVYHSTYFAIDRDHDGDWSDAEIYYVGGSQHTNSEIISWTEGNLKTVLTPMRKEFVLHGEPDAESLRNSF